MALIQAPQDNLQEAAKLAAQLMYRGKQQGAVVARLAELEHAAQDAGGLELPNFGDCFPERPRQA